MSSFMLFLICASYCTLSCKRRPFPCGKGRRLLCVCAVKEGHNLSAGTQVVRGEGQGACAARDAQGDGPGDRRGAVARFRNVRVAAVRVARGRARRAVEERHDLAAGAGCIRGEGRCACALGDAVFNGPEDGVVTVIRRFYTKA